jgi:hypothetical protein
MADELNNHGSKENNAFNPADPETAKLVTTVVSIQEREKTVRTVSICVASVLVAGLIAWAIVRIYTRDFWIELFTILLAPTGGMALLIRWLAAKARKTFDKGLAQITAPQAIPTEPPKGKQP